MSRSYYLKDSPNETTLVLSSAHGWDQIRERYPSTLLFQRAPALLTDSSSPTVGVYEITARPSEVQSIRALLESMGYVHKPLLHIAPLAQSRRPPPPGFEDLSQKLPAYEDLPVPEQFRLAEDFRYQRVDQTWKWKCCGSQSRVHQGDTAASCPFIRNREPIEFDAISLEDDDDIQDVLDRLLTLYNLQSERRKISLVISIRQKLQLSPAFWL